jgi:hypothetical protein
MRCVGAGRVPSDLAPDARHLAWMDWISVDHPITRDPPETARGRVGNSVSHSPAGAADGAIEVGIGVVSTPSNAGSVIVNFEPEPC